MKLFICDKTLITKDNWDETSDGRLRTPVTLTRTGIFKYLYSEIFKKNNPDIPKNLFKDGIINVYRSKEEVLSEKSLNSMKGMILTDEHPPELVTPENYQKYSKGSIDGELTIREEKYNDFSIFFIDGILTTIDKDIKNYIKTGSKNQISLGYIADYNFLPGIFGNQNYDAIQQEIDNNHTAIVSRGRAGNLVKIKSLTGDYDAVFEHDENNFIKNKEKKYFMIIKGKEVTLDALGETLVTQVIDEKDNEIKALQEKVKTIDSLEAKNLKLEKDLSDAKDIDINALTKERVSIIDKASKYIKAENFDSMSNIDIMKAVVKKQYENKDLSGKSDDFFTDSFDLLDAKPATPKILISDSFNGVSANVETLDELDKMTKMITDAYKEASGVKTDKEKK